MPNRLTPLYSKIYYKEENYLKVRTVVFKYITPPYSKGWVHWYISILVCFMFLRSHVLIFLNFCYVLSIWLGYPLSYSSTGFTGSISSVSYVLILSCLRSCLSICTILFIRFVIPAPSSISLSLKNLVSKLLIRGVLCPVLIW